MAHLWVTNETSEWGIEPLAEDYVRLSPRFLPDRSYRLNEPDPSARTVALMRVTGTNAHVWILMSGPDTDVRINGTPLAGGIRVMCDRDEIVVNGVRRYFSTETLARVESFRGGTPTAACPRCQQTIETGTNAVRCPRCQVWHHQSDTLPCWSYADTCAVCPQPTDLATGFQWTPEVDNL